MLSLTIVIIVFNISLGASILSQARRDFDAIIFFFITLAFSLLSLANYFSLTPDLPKALYWIRIEMFLAAWHTFFFLIFVHTFTKRNFPYTKKRALAFVLPFLCVLIISLTPYLFSGVRIDEDGMVVMTTGLLFPVYALWLFGTMYLSIFALVRKYKESEGVVRSQWKYMLIGTVSTYLPLVIFNFIFSAFLHNTSFVPYTPLYSIPIVVATAYAIVKHNIFNIKMLATQAFVTIICVLYLAKVIIADSMTERFVDGAILIFTAFFGLLLIRSVKQEVRAREEIKVLADKLAVTNTALEKTNERLRIMDQRKSEFVSIASHQLRTPITAIKGYSSMLLEDSFGTLPDEARAPIDKIFRSSSRLAEMVTDFLNVSKIEQGTMTYTFTTVDVGAMIADMGEDFAQVAKNKKLKFTVRVPKKDKFIATADEGKIRQIFSNLIDNSIKYTPKGSVEVAVARDEERGMIIVNIKDTGIGLSQDDIHHLFGKFTRGSGGQKQNTEGSGLGLYVAKSMLEAQKGNIWVDSEGAGKGSTFFVELRAE